MGTCRWTSTGLDKGVLAVATGGHSCAVKTNGKLSCWGDNSYGQLGDGTRTDSATPVIVTDLAGVTEVAVGSSHTCALTDGGGVNCWGSNRGRVRQWRHRSGVLR